MAYEAKFLQEWLVWHLVIAGFSHIVVYLHGEDVDNSLEVLLICAHLYNYFQVLEPFTVAGLVTVIPWGSQSAKVAPQLLAYSHFLRSHIS